MKVGGATESSPLVFGGSIVDLSRVLAAVDFSSPARSAFEYALALATRHGAELVVVQAVPPEQPFNHEGRERSALKTSLRRMAEEANLEFTYRVQHGDPAEIILLHAQSIRPDVIVIGSHQRRGLERWRVGSVSEHVVAQASVPVLVVPARLRLAATGAFRHVAVAVDPTAAPDAAVQHALQVATDATERITLLHAVPGFESGVPPHFYGYGVAEYQRQLARDARHAMQLAAPVKRESRPAIYTRVLRGETATDFSRVLESIGADLLVVGVPRRGILARALFGTTAARLLKAIDIPMLAVPSIAKRIRRQEDASLPRAA
jgi:nucleotide-binding universal stress UspA family protein